MNELKVAYRNKLLLPASLDIIYSTALHFTSKPCAPLPPKSREVAQFINSVSGRPER